MATTAMGLVSYGVEFMARGEDGGIGPTVAVSVVLKNWMQPGVGCDVYQPRGKLRKRTDVFVHLLRTRRGVIWSTKYGVRSSTSTAGLFAAQVRTK